MVTFAPMKVLTSISPSHANKDAQAIAVRSWIEHKLIPVSFNSAKEIETLAPLYPGVQFVDCHRTGQVLYKAPYAMISAMLDYAKAEGMEHAFMVNSDIAINDPANTLAQYVEKSKEGLVFSNRYDHNGDNQNPTRYDFGFDAFIVHRDHFHVLPQSLFAMGQTWWDYWIPYRFIQSKVPIELVKEPIFLHHRHNVQYNTAEWVRMTEHFMWMERWTNPRRQPQQVTNEVFQMIKRHAK